jgi:hypothetical protein
VECSGPGECVRPMTLARSPITWRAIRSTRRVISVEARLEKVIKRIRRGSAPLTIRCATR